MQKYLEKPCTRCGKKTVIPPLKNDVRKPNLMVICETCGKKSRYIVHHTGKGDTYSLSPVGRKSRGFVRKIWYVTLEDAKMDAEEHRAALDFWRNR